MDSSSTLNYSYTTQMWSVTDLFSFHVTMHFTLKNMEKIIIKKNIQNGSNKSDSVMISNQLKTVRAISQNIMNTKYKQITVNTKCAHIKEFYCSFMQFVCTTLISTVGKHARYLCPSDSDKNYTGWHKKKRELLKKPTKLKKSKKKNLLTEIEPLQLAF